MIEYSRTSEEPKEVRGERQPVSLCFAWDVFFEVEDVSLLLMEEVSELSRKKEDNKKSQVESV